MEKIFPHPTLPYLSFDSMLRCVLEELSAMEARLLARIDDCGGGLERRVANSKRRASYAGDPIFDVDLVDGPVFDTFYDNLDDGPSFDEEPFADPIVDAAPASDHAAFTVLKFANRDPTTDDLADGPVFDTNPDDLDDQAVFDTELVLDRVDAELAVFHQWPDDLVATHSSVNFDDDPLFDEEPDSEEAELIPDQAVVLGANVTTPATNFDVPLTCSMSCLHIAVNTALVGRAFKTYCSSICDSGELLLDEICRVLGDFELLIHGISTTFFIDPGLAGLVISAPVAIAPFESKYWDPGLAGVAGVMNRTSSRVDFHWDSGLLDGLYYIEFTRYCAKNYPEYLHWLSSNLLTQQKCGGCLGRNLNCHVLAYGGYGAQLLSVAQMLSKFLFVAMVPDAKIVSTSQLLGVLSGIYGCKLSSEFQVLQIHHAAVRGAVKPLVVSEDSDFSWTLFEVVGLLDVHWLVAALSEVLILWHAYHNPVYAQLQVSVSYWCTEMIFMWGYQWLAFWNNCVAKMLQLWDPENSECSSVCLWLKETNIIILKCINCVMLIWIISAVGGVLLSDCVLNLYKVTSMVICFILLSLTGQGTRCDKDQSGVKLSAELAGFQGGTGWILVSVIASTDNGDSALILNSHYYAVPLQGVLFLIHWNLGTALLYTSQDMLEHWCLCSIHLGNVAAILVAVTNQADMMAYGAQWLNLIMVQWNASWLTIPNEGTAVECGVAPVGYVSSLDFSEAIECFCGSLPNIIGSDNNMRLQELLSQLLAALSSILGSFSGVPVIYSSITQMVAWEDMKQAIHECLMDMICQLPLLIPETAEQKVSLGFITGLLQSENAWQLGNLVFLNVMLEIECKPDVVAYKWLEMVVEPGHASLQIGVAFIMSVMASLSHSTKQSFPIPWKLLFAAISTNAFEAVLFYSELVAELLLNMDADLVSFAAQHHWRLICKLVTSRRHIIAYELMLLCGATGLERTDERTILDIYGDYFLAWSGICCVDGDLVVHKTLVIPDLGIQLQLLISRHLCKKDYVVSWWAVQQWHCSMHIGVILILAGQKCLSQSTEPWLHIVWTHELLFSAVFHRPSLFAEHYSYLTKSSAQSKWFDDILPSYADNAYARGWVANLSLDKDVVHEFLLHCAIGSSSAGQLIIGGDMEVLSCLLLGAMLAGIAEAVDQLNFELELLVDFEVLQ